MFRPAPSNGQNFSQKVQSTTDVIEFAGTRLRAFACLRPRKRQAILVKQFNRVRFVILPGRRRNGNKRPSVSLLSERVTKLQS